MDLISVRQGGIIFLFLAILAALRSGFASSLYSYVPMLILLRLCQLTFLVLYFQFALDWFGNDPAPPFKSAKRFPRFHAFAFAFTAASMVLLAPAIAALGLNLQSEYGKKVANPKLRMISLVYAFIAIPLFIAVDLQK
jgi:hypothetical protein